MTSRTCLVVVTSLVSEKELHSYDLGVPGVYLIEGIDPYQIDEVACDTALESFHNREPVKVLEDFDIRVVDANSRVELRPSAQAMDSVEVVDCHKLSDDIPDWVAAMLQPLQPAQTNTLRQNSIEPGW